MWSGYQPITINTFVLWISFHRPHFSFSFTNIVIYVVNFGRTSGKRELTQTQTLAHNKERVLDKYLYTSIGRYTKFILIWAAVYYAWWAKAVWISWSLGKYLVTIYLRASFRKTSWKPCASRESRHANK